MLVKSAFLGGVGAFLASESRNPGCELDAVARPSQEHRVQNQSLKGGSWGGWISKLLMGLEPSQLVLEPVTVWTVSSKGRMSPSWGGEGFALKTSIAHDGFWLFIGKDTIFSGGRWRSRHGSTAVTPSPGPAARPAPSCPFAATPGSFFAFAPASPLWPPLQHPFTTSFDVLLPPQGSCTGPCLHSPPRG